MESIENKVACPLYSINERTVVKAVLESLIIRHDAGRWSKGRVKTG